jgi:hypothetical protein
MVRRMAVRVVGMDMVMFRHGIDPRVPQLSRVAFLSVNKNITCLLNNNSLNILSMVN